MPVSILPVPLLSLKINCSCFLYIVLGINYVVQLPEVSCSHWVVSHFRRANASVQKHSERIKFGEKNKE